MSDADYIEQYRQGFGRWPSPMKPGAMEDVFTRDVHPGQTPVDIGLGIALGIGIVLGGMWLLKKLR